MKYLSVSVPGYGQIDSGLPSGVPTGGLATGSNAIWTFIILITIIAILFTLWEMGKGGMDLIMSRGVKEKIKLGRERVFYGIFGLLMFFLSFFFISVISSFFGFNIIPFFKFR